MVTTKGTIKEYVGKTDVLTGLNALVTLVTALDADADVTMGEITTNGNTTLVSLRIGGAE